MREIGKEVLETILEGELTDHLGYERQSDFPKRASPCNRVYLAIEEASRKWIFRHREWVVIYSQLVIYFGDRLAEQV